MAAEIPDTRYVERSDGVSIAYRVTGSGPRDLLYIPGFISHLDLMWAEPRFVSFIRRLATFARVIMFDKPGTGLSDPISHVPTVEERADDIRVVLDAAGSERAVLLGFSEGASSALLFTASSPERVESLILFGGMYIGYPSDEDVEAVGISPERLHTAWAAVDEIAADWGRGRSAEFMCPSLSSAADRSMWALFERAAASPRMARGLFEAVKRLDVRAVLPAVHTPTLLLHNVDDFAPVEQSRYASGLMPNARLVELEGRDHVFWFEDPEPALGEIEQFITGARHASEPDRLLATILFVDLVGSTQQAAELGDARWRERLEAHGAFVRRTVQTWRGRVVKDMGDGHLCVFDGPARAVRCALELRDEAMSPVRIGIHTGECEALGDDIGGISVHIGARVGSAAAPGEVLVSGTVKELVTGSPLAFADRGEHELRGVPGRWRLYAAGPGDQPPAVDPTRDLKAADRMALTLARRAPRTMTSAGRLARRLSRG